MHILLVEDDQRISNFIVKGLTEKGYYITLATTGEEARTLVNEQNWDLILMDIMLPGINGIQLTQMIRYKKNYTPILILSALSESEDKVEALDHGADDYLTKPFYFNELLSRMNALTRRSKFNFDDNTHELSVASLRVNLDEHQAYQHDLPLDLSPTEYKLLVYLMQNKNKVLNRTQLLTTVWGINYENNTNVVDVYISYLRSKIDEKEMKMIHTVKGAGYMIKE